MNLTTLFLKLKRRKPQGSIRITYQYTLKY